MNNNNTSYTYMQVNSRDILSDPIYQRRLDATRVKSIVAHFDPKLVNPIKVSYRDGKYYVFDGQHTLAALKAVNGNKHIFAECKVYIGLTLEDEARLFSEQNGISRTVKTNAKMKALYAANDIEIVELHKVVNSIGIIFDFGEYKANNKIIAGATTLKIFRKTSRNDFITIFKLIKDSWNGDADSFNKEMLSGMHIFYTTYKSQIDIRKAVNQFRKISPQAIIREGKVYKDGGDRRYARQLVYAYNKNLRGGKLNEFDLEKQARD